MSALIALLDRADEHYPVELAYAARAELAQLRAQAAELAQLRAELKAASDEAKRESDFHAEYKRQTETPSRIRGAWLTSTGSERANASATAPTPTNTRRRAVTATRTQGGGGKKWSK